MLGSLRLLVQTAKIMNLTLNKGELVDAVLEESRRVSTSPSASILLRGLTGDTLDLYLSHERRKGHESLPVGAIDLLSAKSTPVGTLPVEPDDPTAAILRSTFDIDPKLRMRIPLMRRDSLFGYLDLYDLPDEHVRVPHLTEFLRALADLFVIGWDNAELYEQMQHKSRQNDLLLESARILSLSLELDEVLENMMTALKNVVDYDAVGIFLLKEETNRVEPRVWRGYLGEDSRSRLGLKVGEGLIGWVVQHGEGIFVPDVRRDKIYQDARPGTLSELVVPIKTGDKIIGALNLESDKLDAYSKNDLDFLTVFASHASVSIERARLYREILSNRKLEEQLNVARMIQQTFLPRKSPAIPGFDIAGTNIPSQKVGGDYYDFIQIVERQMGIAIADVSGKGMPASLIMAAFRASLIAEIRNNYAIRTILQKVNRLMYESVDRGGFVTAVYGVLDSKNRIFTFSNAGHNPPILIRKNGSYEELVEGGLALGITNDCQYEECPVYLAAGDMLVFYTDGVTEATSREGEHFGEKRILDLLISNRSASSENLVRMLVDSVREFTAEDFEPDDLTLIIVKSV
jgi:sigma-B regulation protein RsbU (phosphoserine phosphatase)